MAHRNGIFRPALGLLNFDETVHGWALDMGMMIGNLYCDVARYNGDVKSRRELRKATKTVNELLRRHRFSDDLCVPLPWSVEEEHLEREKSKTQKSLFEVMDALRGPSSSLHHVFGYVGFAGGVVYAAGRVEEGTNGLMDFASEHPDMGFLEGATRYTRKRAEAEETAERLYKIARERLEWISGLHSDLRIEPEKIMSDLRIACMIGSNRSKLDVPKLCLSALNRPSLIPQDSVGGTPARQLRRGSTNKVMSPFGGGKEETSGSGEALRVAVAAERYVHDSQQHNRVLPWLSR